MSSLVKKLRAKKLMWLGMSFCLSLIFVGAMVSVVLAAISQTINSNIQVSYVAKEVAGTVSATYKVGSDAEIDMKTENNKTTIVFTGEENESSVTLKPQTDIKLTSSNTFVVFKYLFTNTGDSDYVASVSYDQVDSNLKMEVSKDGVNFTEVKDYSVLVPNNTLTPISYYIKFSISDLAQNVDASVNFKWDLVSIPKETVALYNGDPYNSFEDVLDVAISNSQAVNASYGFAGAEGQQLEKIITLIKDVAIFDTLNFTTSDSLIIRAEKDVVLSNNVSGDFCKLGENFSLIFGLPYDTKELKVETSISSGSLFTGAGKYILNSGTIENTETNTSYAFDVTEGGEFYLNGGTIKNFSSATYVNSSSDFIFNGGNIESCSSVAKGLTVITVDIDGDFYLENVSMTNERIIVKNGNLIINNSTFNDYPYHAISVLGGTAIITNSAFSNTRSAAVLVDGNSSVTIEDTTFEDCKVTSTYSLDTNVYISGGAGVFVSRNATATLKNVTIENCEVASGYAGGALFNKGTLNILGESTISSNTGTNGGSIYNTGILTINGATFTKNVGGKGGAICSDGGQLYLNDVKFEENSASTTHGGAINASGIDSDKISISNCIFKSNSAVDRGGAVYLSSCAPNGTGKIDDSVNISSSFYNNVSSELGGAIFVETCSVYYTGSIYGGLDENNQRESVNANSGGAIYTSISKFTMASNAIIKNCKSASYGGAIYTNSGSFNIQDAVTIVSNASNIGGAIFITSSGFNIKNNVLINSNSSTDIGGAICSNGSSTINITGGEFSSNTATGKGGVICMFGGVLTISNATFKQNSTEFDGGVAYLDGSTISIDNSSLFESNSATQGAGVIMLSSVKNANINGIYKSNSALEAGGVIIAQASSIATIDGEYYNNSTAELGGTMLISDSQITFVGEIYGGENKTDKRSTVNAKQGGAIRIEGGSLTLGDGAIIANNKATEYGGGVYAGNATLEMNGSASVINNDANIAGGLFVSGTTFTMRGTSSILNNTSVDIGGGICANNTPTITIEAGTISGNISSKSGGGIFQHEGVLSISNCTFIGNSSGEEGGAVKINTAASLSIQNSIFKSNVATTVGGAVAMSGCMTSGTGSSTDSVNITGTFFNNSVTSTQSSSGEGGAICVDNGSLYFRGSIYGGENETAVPTGVNAQFSGAMHITSTGKVTVDTGSIIKNCKAKAGGAIINGGTLTFNGAISDCSADYCGGIANISTLNLNGSILDCQSTETTVGNSIVTFKTVNIYSGASINGDICIGQATVSYVFKQRGSISVKEDLGSSIFNITFGDGEQENMSVVSVSKASGCYSYYASTSSSRVLITFDNASHMKVDASGVSTNFTSSDGTIKKKTSETSLYIVG